MKLIHPTAPAPGRPGFSPSDGGLAGCPNFLARAADNPLADAFNRKFTIHAGLPTGGPPAAASPRAYTELLNSRVASPLGLYIHIPFCHNQCLYCGFNGRRPAPEFCRAYVEALIEEMAWIRERGSSFGPIQAVYLGGGTPTLIAPALLDRLLNAVKKNFDLANDCEITLEGRLHDFSPERAEEFLGAGFNRFSIGVQSFDTAIRQRLGRLSDRDRVVKMLENLIRRQKAAVIIDLIYGLPGQTPDGFVDDLCQAASLGVDGLDTYQLNIFPGSVLDQRLKSGRLPAAAPLRDQGEYYRRAADYLLRQRWRQLSLSHFGRTSRERNIYNPLAKRQDDCLALGAGAGGFLSGWSFYRLPNLEKYLENAARRDFVPDILKPPTPAGRLTSFIIGQMEQGYLNYRGLATEFGIGLESLEPLLVNWNENGLIDLDEGWLTMTLSGRFWGVNLTQAVIETAAGSIKEN